MRIRIFQLSMLVREGKKAKPPHLLQDYGGKEGLCDVIRTLDPVKMFSPGDNK